MALAESLTLQIFRILLLGLLVSAVWLPEIWQPMLSACWRYLLDSPIYELSVFETALTMLCYIVIEPCYTAVFARSPARRVDVRKPDSGSVDAKPPLPKMKRPSTRLWEMLVYATPLLSMDLVMIKKYAGVGVEAIRRSGGYGPTASLPPGSGHGSIKAHFLAPTLHKFTMGSPLQLRRALPPLPPSSRRIVLELATAFFLYDALFFAIHILFHRITVLHRIHGPHHKHNEMHPQVTNHLSVAERVALILLANFSLNIIGSHVFTRTCFVPLFVYLLIEVHSGVDLPWQYDKILPKGWGAGARKHADHHRYGKRYFAPFFSWWDDTLEWWDRMRSQKMGTHVRKTNSR